MWNDYKAKGGTSSYAIYLKIFQQERITFGRPNQDLCDSCASFDSHLKETGEHNSETCTICKSAVVHRERFKLSRQEYQRFSGNSAEGDMSVFAADMQRVLLLPKLQTKEHFFVSRLVVFNETLPP